MSMFKTSPKLVTLLALIIVVVAAVGLLALPPATAHAASGLGNAHCADKKANCPKKGGNGNGAQGAGQSAQNTSTPAQDQACQGLGQVDSSLNCNEANGGAQGETQVSSTVGTVVSVLSMVTGILGIIFILLSGFRYMTSNGDQNRVAKAKTTLIYALIGLAVAATAQLLIHTVLSTSYNCSQAPADQPAKSFCSGNDTVTPPAGS